MGFFDWFKPGKGKQERIDLKKRFDMQAQSGQGSMSKVWRAYDRKIARIVCLKILHKEKTAHFEARFVGLQRPTEGAICMLLRHKNVVQTYEHGITTDGEPFLVMEWIDGVGLNFLIETKSPQLKGKRIDYLLQITNGVDYIHNQRFMHRDICPRNVMVTPDGVVKIIDFGLCIPYRPEFCRPGNRTGTPNYLAPEIIKRVGTDHRVDLFALGVTAYETIVGRLPWEKAQSLQTLLSHMNRAGDDPRVHRKDLDEDMVKLLIKAIDRDRNLRFQTAGEFRDALRALPNQDY